MTSTTNSAAAFDLRESGAFLAIAIVVLTAPAVVSTYLHHHVAIAAAIVVVTIAIIVPFASLHVRARDGRLRVLLGGFITVRDVALADIVAVERFRPPGLAGIGIRWLAEGTLYTVTLGDAVEIRLRDGSRFFIGSDSPGLLCTRIQEAARSGAGH